MTNCSSKKTPPAQDAIELPEILVNGTTIDQASFAAEIQYHKSASLDEAVHKAGQALIIKELLRQALARQKRSVETDDEEQAFAELVAENARYEAINEADSKRYYEQNLDKFETSPILEVSHILLSAAPDDTSRRIEQQNLADDLLMQLQEKPELFSEFVSEFSDCPSKETGGSLGQISNGQTVVEFERQLFSLPEGLHDRALESRYGYHIANIHKKIAGKQLEFSMVEDQIDKYLNHRRYRQAIADYLYQLADQAEIHGFELQLEQENIHIG